MSATDGDGGTWGIAHIHAPFNNTILPAPDSTLSVLHILRCRR